MNFRHLILFSGVMVLMLSSCGQTHQSKGKHQEIAEYPILHLQKQEAYMESVYPAVIKGREDIEIRPRVDGFIKGIFVDEGSVVKKGQSLFKIDSPQAEQGFLTAQAAVNSAQAQVNTAKIDVSRYRPLAEKGIISNVQLEIAENAYQTALATLAQAQATLIDAKATLSWTNVVSPVNGFVGAITYRQGSLVNASNVLTIVANTSDVFAYFSLNEKSLMELLNSLKGKSQFEKIKNMPPVTLRLADGTIYPEKGRIETIAGVVDITTGSANFRAQFPNPHGFLRSGTSGKISIPEDMKNVIVIPQKATFAQQDKVLVYKVQADSVVEKTVVVHSTPDGKDYVVTDGLAAGDIIVSDGIATLYNGKKIKGKY